MIGGGSSIVDTVRGLGSGFAARAGEYDRQGRFAAESVAELKQGGLLAAGVPAELGGRGASFPELCEVARTAAKYCPATALAFAMHTHTVASLNWRWRRGLPGEHLLRRVASESALLVTSGAHDWLTSSGSLEKTETGYRANARKCFATGCPAGDVLVSSAKHECPKKGTVVLHFAVSTRAPGVGIEEAWDAHGMRASGSHDVVLSGVDIPESAVIAERPGDGSWHPSMTVALVAGLPLIMAVYLGIAERAATLALDATKARGRRDDLTCVAVGEMLNHLAAARSAHEAMVSNAANLEFPPELSRADLALSHKTLVARDAIAATETALGLGGGSAYRTRGELERLVRDVRAGAYHPLPRRRQECISGRIALGLAP